MTGGKLHIRDYRADFYGYVSGLTFCGKPYSGSTKTGRAVNLTAINPESKASDDKIRYARTRQELCRTCDRGWIPA